MNKGSVKYMERKPTSIPTEVHGHTYSVLSRVKGNRVRFSCKGCPAMGEWVHVDQLFDDEVGRMNAVKAERRERYERISENQRAVLAMLVDMVTGKAAWTTDSEGRTPDENPMDEGTWPSQNPPVDVDLHQEDDVVEQVPSNIPGPNDTKEELAAKLDRMAKSAIMSLFGEKHKLYKSWTKDKMVETILRGKS